MTGYGEAHYQSDGLTVTIELRALNNRYLKVSLRAAEPHNLLESEFEKVIRRTIRRGTIQAHLRIDRQLAAQEYQINVTALRSYVSQLKGVWEELGLRDRGEALLTQVLALPGVVPEPGGAAAQAHHGVEGVTGAKPRRVRSRWMSQTETAATATQNRPRP